MLTPTAKVILGMVRLGRRTGYEMKQLVDNSTRFFWAASYGQLYPELKRLEDEGLVAGAEASTNGRRRRAFELTDAGEEALEAWLRSDDPGAYEYRDEAMLKVFFWDGLGVEDKRRILHLARGRHEEIVGRLEEIEPRARMRGGGPYAALRGGIALHRFSIEWLDQLDAELDEQPATEVT